MFVLLLAILVQVRVPITALIVLGSVWLIIQINILIYYHMYHYEQNFRIMSWGKCELLSPVKN